MSEGPTTDACTQDPSLRSPQYGERQAFGAANELTRSEDGTSRRDYVRTAFEKLSSPLEGERYIPKNVFFLREEVLIYDAPESGATGFPYISPISSGLRWRGERYIPKNVFSSARRF